MPLEIAMVLAPLDATAPFVRVTSGGEAGICIPCGSRIPNKGLNNTMQTTIKYICMKSLKMVSRAGPRGSVN